MSTITPINKRGLKDVAYVAGFNNQKIGLWAQSAAEAKQRATEHFKPKKSAKHLVWVERAVEEDADNVATEQG